MTRLTAALLATGCVLLWAATSILPAAAIATLLMVLVQVDTHPFNTLTLIGPTLAVAALAGLGNICAGLGRIVATYAARHDHAAKAPNGRPAR